MSISKWTMLMLSLLLLQLMTFALCEENEKQEGTFILPKSVQIIEDEAFENTYAALVVIPEKVVSIGNRAFSDSRRLEAVYIPASTIHIGHDAFQGTGRLTVFGEENSYAHDWAKQQGYRFIVIDLYFIQNSNHELFKHEGTTQKTEYIDVNHNSSPFRSRNSFIHEHIVIRKKRPELYPIDYDFP